MATDRQVLDPLLTWARAELDGDVDAHPDLLAEDFHGVGPAGSALDAHRRAQGHTGDLTNREPEILEPQVRSYGDTAVVEAIQRQVTTARGRGTSGSFRPVAACIPDPDGWRIAHLQLSRPMIAPGEMPGFAR